jgi:hypothetical protein
VVVDREIAVLAGREEWLIMVRLMCAPPEENFRPNVSKAGEATGKLSAETPQIGNWKSSRRVMFFVLLSRFHRRSPSSFPGG